MERQGLVTADREDASVHPDEPPGPNATRDGVVRIPESKQL